MKKSRTPQLIITLVALALLVLSACGRSSSGNGDSAATTEEGTQNVDTTEKDDASSEDGEAEVNDGKAATETDSTDAAAASDESSSAALNALKMEALETYANIAYASYEDSLELAIALQAAIEEFIANPTEETHRAAQDAWLAANEPYGQTETYRFYGGPIDDENGPEGLLNAWPLDEAYVDYIDGNEGSGIINMVDEYPTIDKELIASLNEVGAEENISTGYHAIEFLLWGQDQSAETNGQRPYTDYVTDGGGTAANQERRAAYLSAAAQLLVENLTDVTSEWEVEREDNYRDAFLSMDPDQAMAMVFTGMGVLSKAELAGERMFTAYDNQDQEDEHSCFSDNTHRDIITNNQGIYNVYFGSYTRLDGSKVSGTSFSDVLAASNPVLNDEMTTLLTTSVALINEIPVPFDQAIIDTDGREKVLKAVFALQDQGDKLAQAAGSLGLLISTDLP